MAESSKVASNHGTSGASLNFEQKRRAAVDKIRSYIDPAEYKNVVLRLIFLKYISDAFKGTREELTLFVVAL